MINLLLNAIDGGIWEVIFMKNPFHDQFHRKTR